MVSSGAAGRVFTVLVTLLIAANAVFAFVGLGASSLWIDELYTYYFSDTTLHSVTGVIRRSAEDVHPPLYYIVAHYLRDLSGGYEIPLRALSAACACLAVAIVYFGTRSHVGRYARLLGACFALTSVYLYEYMQFARSNALSILLVAGIAVTSLALLAKFRRSSSSITLLLVLFLLSVVGAFVHFYVLVIAGAVYAVLLLGAIRWSDRTAILISGVLVLAAFLPYLIWQMSFMVSTDNTTWFEATVPFFSKHIRQYLGMQFGSRPMIALLITIAIVLVIAAAHLRWGRICRVRFSPVVVLSVGVPFLTIVLGIVVSVALAPSLSDRNLTLSAPFFWILVAVLFERALRWLAVFDRFAAFRQSFPTRGNERFVTAVLEGAFWVARALARKTGVKARDLLLLMAAVVLLLSSSVLLQRAYPRHQEWRQSASFVSELEACRDSVIPVAAHDHDAIEAREVDLFYRYYLNEPDAYDLLEVRLDELFEPTFENARWRAVMEERLDGTDSCPILLWGVHHLTSWELKQLDEALKLFFGSQGGEEITLYRFPHRMVRMGSPFTSDYRWCDDAFVFLTNPIAGKDTKAPGDRGYSC